MLFEYEEDDGSTLMWCQGKVVDFIRESKEKHVFVKIEWSGLTGLIRMGFEYFYQNIAE